MSLDSLKTALTDTDNGFNKPGKFFRYWKMAAGDAALIRFLPDLDTSNKMSFLVEQRTHHLLDAKGTSRDFGCSKIDQWSNCPACDISKEIFFQAEREVDYEKSVLLTSIGRKIHWKKAYLAQIVVLDPGNVEINQDRTVFFISFGPQIFARIIQTMKGEPHLMKNGYNFWLKKVRSNNQNNYESSHFVEFPTDLDNDIIVRALPEMIELKKQIIPPFSYTSLKTASERTFQQMAAGSIKGLVPHSSITKDLK